MSSPNQQPDNQNQEEQQQQQEDPNSLTEEDKKVYAEIMGSISRMDKKLKHVKQKVPNSEETANETKRTSANQIAEKLIQSKQNSDIITKQDLVADVQQTFEQMVVNVYTENQQMKKKIASLIAIIKDQNKKLNDQKEVEEKLRHQNQHLRSEVLHMKDHRLVTEQTTIKKGINNQSNVSKNPKQKTTNTYENEDYDFWSMPNNENSSKKRKDFVADSGLWVNDKDIDKSVFITDQRGKR